jgi:hypothetical protein
MTTAGQGHDGPTLVHNVRHCKTCDIYWPNLEFAECNYCGSTDTEIVEDEYTEDDGSREVPFDPEMVCDVCGKLGAWDFMGDGICPECMRKGCP